MKVDNKLVLFSATDLGLLICRNTIEGRYISSRCHYLEFRASNQPICSRYFIAKRGKTPQPLNLKFRQPLWRSNVWDTGRTDIKSNNCCHTRIMKNI